MTSFKYKDREYEIDDQNSLTRFEAWDEQFAEGMAAHVNIPGGLTNEHWDVIVFIRNAFKKTGRCPLVYEVCRMSGLTVREMKRLFPTGYQRGACVLAGITYRDGYLGQSYLPKTADDLNLITMNKTYRVDVRGFLVDPNDWDEYYATYRAYDMKIPGGYLTDEHWRIINFLRDSFNQTGVVPTVYDTCEANGIEINELERLFPDGYHRGAVKISGLRVR